VGRHHTQDGGLTWTNQPTPVQFRTIDFVDSKIGYGLGQNAQLYRTTSSGKAWTLLWTAPYGSSWTDGGAWLTFGDQQNGWLLLSMGQACAGQMPNALYHTRDDGIHWTLDFISPGACGGIGEPSQPDGPYGPPGYPKALSQLLGR
jgi:hypothetical protein